MTTSETDPIREAWKREQEAVHRDMVALQIAGHERWKSDFKRFLVKLICMIVSCLAAIAFSLPWTLGRSGSAELAASWLTTFLFLFIPLSDIGIPRQERS